MKKTAVRRMTAAVAAICMCAMMAAPLMSNAADVTIKGTENVSVAEKTFNAYQLFEVSEAASGYFVNCTDDDVKAYFAEKIDCDVDDAELNTKIGNYLSDLDQNGDAAAKMALARDLLTVAKTAGIEPVTVTGEGNADSVTFAGLVAGYYVIEDASSGAGDAISSVMLQNSAESVEIDLKADKPTIQKKIVEGTELVDANTASVGDTVNYQLNTVVPDTTYYTNYTFNITDTIVTGLDLCNASGVVVTVMGDNKATADTEVSYALTQGTDYTVTYIDSDEDGHDEQMVIRILNMAALGKTNAGDEIVVTYSAVLNKDAVVGTSGNVNDVVLEYSNNPNCTPDDMDGDGIPNDEDTDDDNDNIPDNEDNDKDNDGIPDDEDTDKDNDGTPDEEDDDDDGDGIPDDDDDDDNTPPTTTETVHDKVLTYVTELKIAKVDPDGKALNGAKFSIEGEGLKLIVKTDTSAAGETVVTVSTAGSSTDEIKAEAEVSENGYLVFRGLGAGTYTITETEAPEGYNRYANSINVTITCAMADTTALNAVEIGDGNELCKWTYASTTGGDVTANGDGDIYTITVVNRKGVTFPVTGGMGTTIFTIAGVTMMLGAAGLVVVKRRNASR